MSTNPTDPRFPDWFPSIGCPPASAADPDGVVFRFAKHNPLAEEDFQSHHELGLSPKANACSRVSLSVFRAIAPARKRLRDLRERYPARFGSHIAEGRLKPEHGKMMQVGTDPDHYEWWAYEGVERHSLFRIVETLDSQESGR